MLLLSLINSCYYHFTTTIISPKINFVYLFIIICFVLFYLYILLFIRFELRMLSIRIIYYDYLLSIRIIDVSIYLFIYLHIYLLIFYVL